MRRWRKNGRTTIFAVIVVYCTGDGSSPLSLSDECKPRKCPVTEIYTHEWVAADVKPYEDLGRLQSGCMCKVVNGSTNKLALSLTVGLFSLLFFLTMSFLHYTRLHTERQIKKKKNFQQWAVNGNFNTFETRCIRIRGFQPRIRMQHFSNVLIPGRVKWSWELRCVSVDLFPC